MPSTSSTPIRSRRALHLPFFPLLSPSPAEPPSSSTPQRPFFPSYPSPPPPQPTFAANISSLTFSGSRSAPPARHTTVVVAAAAAVLIPLLVLALLAAAAAFFLHRHRHRLRCFPCFDKDQVPAPAAADLPHHDALVDTRLCGLGEDGVRPAAGPTGGSPDRKLQSPELRPLPLLPRQFPYGCGEGEMGASSSEEFYSPRGSLAEKGSAGCMSTSRRTFTAAVEKCGSQSSTKSSNMASSPLSPPVASSPHVGSSPSHSSGRSLMSTSQRSLAGGLEYTVLPQPPPPPRPPRPLTPSPPKQKPSMPSPPSSPEERESERKMDHFDLAGSNLRSTMRLADSPSPPGAQPQRQAPPPPPLPPPPPTRHWESQVRESLARKPPIAPPEPTGTKAPPALVNPTYGVEKKKEGPRPKLKPLHWDKVQASSKRAMVWDQLKSSSFRVDEEMIETLFVCNATNGTPKETNKQQVRPVPTQENRVLDQKKSQNIAILLRALNVTKEEVCEALSEAGNADSLGTELLETLLKMAPSKEEERKLKAHEEDSPFKLGPAEKFLKALLDIPFAFKRVDAMLYIAAFDSEANFLRKSFETLEAACEELRNSRLFLRLLEAVLKTGNHMNVGTNRGDAHAFKLDTLLKLADVKGIDGKTTLLHFVVQEIIRTEGSHLAATNNWAANAQDNTLPDDLECRKLGLQVITGLEGELSNVKKAAAVDSDMLHSYVTKLAGGIKKVDEVLRSNEEFGSEEDGCRFRDAMDQFRKKAEDDIIKVQAQESVALSLVKEITEYFHGNSVKEEAHPFRIFVVVRDFLSILDQVCKEVGRINEQAVVSSSRQFPVPINPTLSPAFLRFHALRPKRSDEESSRSS
ncbi:unnamed protein product [Musa acuminata subsp. burmannicoides]